MYTLCMQGTHKYTIDIWLFIDSDISCFILVRSSCVFRLLFISRNIVSILLLRVYQLYISLPSAAWLSVISCVFICHQLRVSLWPAACFSLASCVFPSGQLRVSLWPASCFPLTSCVFPSNQLFIPLSPSACLRRGSYTSDISYSRAYRIYLAERSVPCI